jgi:hypothetical protein
MWQSWWCNRRKITRWIFLVIASMLVNLAWLIPGSVLVVGALSELQSEEPDIVSLNWILLVFLAYFLFLCILAKLTSHRLEKGFPRSLFSGFGSLAQEVAGGLVLSTLLLVLVTIPEQRAAKDELKTRLIRELRSSDNGTALLAADELQERGWLYNGTLEGARLWNANLQGARLWDAHLEEAELVNAYLGEAKLVNANLQGAKLWDAHLEGCGGQKVDQ